MLQDFTVTIQGTIPLLLNTSDGMNPHNPILKAVKPLKDLRGKARTESVMEAMAQAEWLRSAIWNQVGSCWLEEDQFFFKGYAEPILPAEYLCKACEVAARADRLGTKVKEALSEGLNGDGILEFDGPKDAESMLVDPQARFIDCRSAVVVKQRIMRSRMRIPAGWRATIALTLDTKILDMSKIQKYIADAGHRTGVGDYRPKFGRFQVVDLTLN